MIEESKEETMKTAREILTEEMENEATPLLILSILQENEGKRLTKRILPKLEERGVKKARIQKSYRMTYLDWGGIRSPKPDKDNGSFLLANSEKNVIIDTEFVRAQNPAYFDARVKRNAIRRKMLASNYPELLDEKVKNFLDAHKELSDILNGDEIYKVLNAYSFGLKGVL